MSRKYRSLRTLCTFFFVLFAGACNAPTVTSALPASPTQSLPDQTSTPIATGALTQITLTPNPTVVAGLPGKWKGDNGSFFLVQPDGKWHWDEVLSNLENSPENTGDWWVEGDVMYMIDRTGPGKCPENYIGSYTVSFQGKELVLTLINDKCGVRVGQTQGHYQPIE